MHYRRQNFTVPGPVRPLTAYDLGPCDCEIDHDHEEPR